MTEKRVSVRLAVVGGREVRAELEGVGEAGNRGFGRLGREMEAANARLAAFSARVKIATAAAIAAAAASGIAMIRSGLATVDAQAKLAQSLGTTVASIQVLERAGELAGVAMSGIEQATKDLTRRLSQAASGAGPAAEALGRLGLSAAELLALPLDERVGRINQAIADFVPVAERAAVAGQLFGEEGSIAMARIDTATLRQATQDVRDFGVVVSEADADRIERTNDAISRLGLIWRGLSNQLAVAAAPALEAVANAMAALARTSGPLGIAIRGLFDNLGRLATYAATFAGVMAGRWVAGLIGAAVSVRGLATALVVLRGALIRTGIGALIVAAGEMVYQFGRLVAGAGGFGEALSLLGDVASEVWERIKLGGRSLALSLQSVWATIEAGWLTALSGIQRSWADFLHAATRSLDGVPGMETTMLRLSEAAIRAGLRVLRDLGRCRRGQRPGRRARGVRRCRGRRRHCAARLAAGAARRGEGLGRGGGDGARRGDSGGRGVRRSRGQGWRRQRSRGAGGGGSPRGGKVRLAARDRGGARLRRQGEGDRPGHRRCAGQRLPRRRGRGGRVREDRQARHARPRHLDPRRPRQSLCPALRACADRQRPRRCAGQPRAVLRQRAARRRHRGRVRRRSGSCRRSPSPARRDCTVVAWPACARTRCRRSCSAASGC